MLNQEKKQTAAIRPFGLGRRLCALALSLVLLLSLFPVTAFAAGARLYRVSSEEELRKYIVDSISTEELVLVMQENITLTKDISLRPNAKIVLYLNEYTLESYAGDFNYGRIFKIPSGAELTIHGGYIGELNAEGKIINEANGKETAYSTSQITKLKFGLAEVQSGGTLRISANTHIWYSAESAKFYLDKAGAIYVKSGGTVELGSTYNPAGGKMNAGAVCEFSECGARQGGAIYMEEDSTLLRGSDPVVMRDCFAEQGGAIYVAGGTADVDTVQNCKATVSGGAIYIEKGTVSALKVTECTASAQGGGIYCNGSFAIKNGGTSVTNCSAEQGGGVYVAEGGVVAVEKAASVKREFSGNKVNGNGAAIYIAPGGKASLSGTTLKDNTATYHGGAIYVQSPAETSSSALLMLSNSMVVSGNTASGVEEDIYLSADTEGQIGAVGLTTGTNIKVTIAEKSSSKAVLRDPGSLKYFTIGGVAGGTGASWGGETSEPTGAIAEDGEVDSFNELKATLEAGISVKLLGDITVEEPITVGVNLTGALVLDLNGMKLTAEKGLDGRMFTVPRGAAFRITSDAAVTANKKAGYIKNAPAGAVAVLDGGMLMIGNNVCFQSCQADRGGAILVNSGSIMSCMGETDDGYGYENCKATDKGGAICVDAGGSLMIDESCSGISFSTCSAGCGGGLYLENGSLFSGKKLVVIDDCEATKYGGGLYAATNVSVQNFSTSGNKAAKGGGTYLAENAELTVEGLYFTNNSATEEGGGLYLSKDSKVFVTKYYGTAGNYLIDNKAKLGGACFLGKGSAFDCEVEGYYLQVFSNTATQKGGAFYLSDGSSANIAEARISENSAGDHGGAIYMEAGTEPSSPMLTLKKPQMIADNKSGELEEDIYLAGSMEEQIRTEGLPNGMKIHLSAKKLAAQIFLDRECKKDIDHFIISDLPDYYLLRVQTGLEPGTNVLYFGVRYIDVDGIERTQFIYPEDAADAYKLAGGVDEVNARVDLVKNLTGYTFADVGSDRFTEQKKGLEKRSTDYFVFEPLHAFRELVGIDVFMNYTPDQKDKTAKQSWNCEGMYFYHVDEFYGLDMTGYYSSQMYISFRGQLLGYLKAKPGATEVEREFIIDRSAMLARVGRNENYPMEIPDTPIPYDSKSDEYLFELEFSDNYGAGVEALATQCDENKQLKGKIVEALTLEVKYEDLNGRTVTVNMPVIVNAAAWAVENGYVDETLPVIGIAQQGESVMFVGSLPEVKEIKSYALTFGEGAASAAKIKIAGTPTSEQNSRLERLGNEHDGCSLVGVRIYSGDTVVVKPKYESSFDMWVADGAMPLYSYTSQTLLGDGFGAGRTVLHLAPFDSERMKIIPSTSTNFYVVSMTTDDMEGAATVDEIEVSIQYVSVNGEAKSTDTLKVKERVENFYGYWPCMNGKSLYQASMQPGKEISFLILLDDLSYFTGATITLVKDENKSTVDDWQMKDFRIELATSISERMSRWENTGFSDRSFWREYTVLGAPLARYPNELDKYDQDDQSGLAPEDRGKVYLSQETPSVTISFSNDGKSSVAKPEDPDWEGLRYSMTYEQAHMDLRFGSTMCEYTVEVKVNSNSSKSEDDDDAGSNNDFYFALVFEKGRSAYVLANQQLSADGFRSEMTETFKIRTNRDYGSVTAVYIIPDDSDAELASDKLNIERITVVEDSMEGVAKTWKINNVGWIGTNYYDKGAEDTKSGRPARSESEIVKAFYVDEQGYSVNVLFAMQTAYGSEGNTESTDATNETETRNSKVNGTISMRVNYVDSSGMPGWIDYDIAEEMYKYSSRTVKHYQAMKQNNSDKKVTDAMIDEFMLRGGHTDRFIIPLPDLQRIISVKFKICPENAITWTMQHLDVYQVLSDGLLQYNVNDELQRSNQVSWLCQSTFDGLTLDLLAAKDSGHLGAEQTKEVGLTDHKLEVDMTESKWKSAISRVPISEDDKLNVYVYMEEAIPEQRRDTFSMSSVVWYNHPINGLTQAGMNNMDLSPDGRIFYALDVSAKGISSLQSLFVKTYDKDDNIIINPARVVVQHIRSGVTIATYTADAYGQDARYSTLEITRDNFTSSAEDATERQTVKIFFSADTKKQMLNPEIDDILVSINYRSVSDADRGGGSTRVNYSSKYVYLTDLKEKVDSEDGQESENRKYTSIRPGMVVEIPFTESDVGEIVSISAASIGSIDATIDSAFVLCTDSEGQTSCYNFAHGTKLSNAPFTLQRSEEENVALVKMAFETTSGLVDTSDSTEVSAEIPIRMKVCYRNNLTNALEIVTFDNLQDYVTSGGFQSKGMTTVEFFLKNVNNQASIRYITLEPYSLYSVGASWGLGTVSYTMEVQGVQLAEVSTTVNKTLQQNFAETEKIVLAKVIVNVTPQFYSEVSGTLDPAGLPIVSSEMEATNIGITAGNSLYLSPNIQGGLSGYGFNVRAVRGTIINSDAKVFCYSVAGNQIIFTPPAEDAVYTVRISYEEIPEVYCDIIVTVSGAPKTEVKETAAPTQTPGSEEEESGSNEEPDSGSGGEGSSGDTPPEA